MLLKILKEPCRKLTQRFFCPYLCLFTGLLILTVKLIGLSKRTGCQIFYSVVRGNVKDSFVPRTYATAEVKEACVHLYKSTPEEMSLKIDAFTTAGLGGVLKTTGGRRSTSLKAEIREMLRKGLCKVIAHVFLSYLLTRFCCR
jgi:hypothetical protein